MDAKDITKMRDDIVSTGQDSDTDSDFDQQEATITPPPTGNDDASDLPPTYEEALRRPTTHETDQLPAPHYDPNMTVYRTEIPPDPPVIVNNEKRPVSPPNPERQAKKLLDEALKFAETPPPQAERQTLRTPIAIPSFAGATAPVKFARFYAPALYPQSVADTDFVEFIDGLNSLAVASHFSAAALELYHARHGMNARSVVIRDDEYVRRDELVPAYLALGNSHFFNPRGLHVRVVNLLQLAEHVNIGNEAIKKTILQEVLRMSQTSIDVPAAANGAAFQAAAALVPYTEALTTAVSEPRKHQEALHAVAAHFANLETTNSDDRHADAVAPSGSIRRSIASNSQSSSSKDGKSWNEWGNDIGNFWSAFGQRQGQFWGRFGEEQGKKWSQWGEEFGKRVASGPPSWVAGPSGRGHRSPGVGGPLGGRAGTRPGMHNRRSSHGWNARSEGWHGGDGSMQRVSRLPHPYTTPVVPPMPHGIVPDVHVPPPLLPNERVITTPPTQGCNTPSVSEQPSMPGAFPLHQPPPPDNLGPHNPRDPGAFDDDNDSEEGNFEDVADRLSLSSVSSISDDSDSDSDRASTLVDDDASDPDVIFAQKAAHIESMAASARARHQKPADEIEYERTKALLDLESQHQKVLSRREHRAQKSKIREEVRAWTRGVKAELKDIKGLDRQEKRVWKQTRKADWRGFKQRLKAQDREYRQERQQRTRQSKQLAKQAKRESEMKACEGKRQEWEGRRREWEGRKAARGGGCAASGRSGSAETLQDQIYTQAKEMLWILVSKHDG